MFYVVWLRDDNDDLNWFTVYGKRRHAMEDAKANANGKVVVYLKLGSGKSYLDYNTEECVVVEQREYLYHGA